MACRVYSFQESISTEAVGTYLLELPSEKTLELEKYYYMPKILRNIISVPLLIQCGYEIKFMGNSCSIFHANKFFDNGYFDNGLLILLLNKNIFYIHKNIKKKREDIIMSFFWHCRLGHIGDSRISKLYKEKFFEPYDFESYGTCESYLIEKMTKTLFFGHGERTNELLTLVHSDVCGPMTTLARGGYFCFITFTDDLLRYGYVYLIKHKFETFDKFKEYQKMIKK